MRLAPPPKAASRTADQLADTVRNATPKRPRTHGPPESFGITDVGCVRSINEDHFVVAELARSILVKGSSVPASELPVFAESNRQLLLVADGLGGHSGGELASRLVAEELVSFLADAIPVGRALQSGGDRVVEQSVRSAIERCQVLIDRKAESNEALAHMGTTVTMAFVARPYMVVGHVGDSRCYLLRRGKLQQLTRDHTMAQEKAEPGATVTSSDGHWLTSAIAGGLLGVTPDVFTVELEPGDVTLLCTDGLTREVSDQTIRNILDSGWSAVKACHLLVQAARTAGGRDNITGVVARFP